MGERGGGGIKVVIQLYDHIELEIGCVNSACNTRDHGQLFQNGL